MYELGDKIVTFLDPASIEPAAKQQIVNTASLPFIFHHVAVMPDCHYGKGATGWGVRTLVEWISARSNA